MNKIRALVVDDSAFVRNNLTRILESDPSIQVIDTAANGVEGLQKAITLRPDVVVLDLLMPEMDGLVMLRHLMREMPTPVVMVSAATQEGARETLEALSLGAVDFVAKPGGPTVDLYAIRDELVQKVKAAYTSKFSVATSVALTRQRLQTVLQELAQPPKAPARPAGEVGVKQLVAIAASTGGPVAIQHVVSNLSANLNAGVVIVLHIAAGFTRALAERLNELSPLTVREAQDGDWITPGLALIAPIGLHTTVVRRSERLAIRLTPEPANALHRPSADVLFESIAACCAAETCAVILTGMGNDGALGLRSIYRAGGYTIAQDESTCIVYGMPRRAVELGGVSVSLPLDQIAPEIVRVVGTRSCQG